MFSLYSCMRILVLLKKKIIPQQRASGLFEKQGNREVTGKESQLINVHYKSSSLLWVRSLLCLGNSQSGWYNFLRMISPMGIGAVVFIHQVLYVTRHPRPLSMIEDKHEGVINCQPVPPAMSMAKVPALMPFEPVGTDVVKTKIFMQSGYQQLQLYWPHSSR